MQKCLETKCWAQGQHSNIQSTLLPRAGTPLKTQTEHKHGPLTASNHKATGSPSWSSAHGVAARLFSITTPQRQINTTIMHTNTLPHANAQKRNTANCHAKSAKRAVARVHGDKATPRQDKEDHGAENMFHQDGHGVMYSPDQDETDQSPSALPFTREARLHDRK